MNLEEGLQKGIDIYANKYLKFISGMNIKNYTYELDFKDDMILFIFIKPPASYVNRTSTVHKTSVSSFLNF